MKKLKSVIMAGGAGTRLRPLTCEMPKPLSPIAGNPCIFYILNLLKSHGIDEACITLQYRGDDIRRAAEQVHELALHYPEEKQPLGTAGSVANCREFLDGDFIVISGDCICDFDLTAAAAYHYSHGGIATIVLTKVKNPLEYGVAVTDDNGVITRFIEKPSWSRAYSDTVNTGIYIFSQEIFDYIPKDKPSDFSKDVFPALMKKSVPIHGYIADGYWCDIGSLSAFMQCNYDVLGGLLRYRPVIAALSEKRVTNPAGAEITEPVYIGKNVSADGAHIGPYTVVGDGCVIGKGSRIENSILFDGTAVGKGSSLRSCIICGAKLGSEVSAGEFSVVGKGSEIGAKTIISAGVRVYPDNIISPGSFIRNTVVEGIQSFLYDEGTITSDAGSTSDISAFVRIGAAAASVLKKNIAIGVGKSRSSKYLLSPALALCSGALSVSSDSFDLGECDINIFRYAVREYGFGGGIYISAEDKRTELTLMQSDGLPFCRENERAFESAFASGEYGYNPGGEFRIFKGIDKAYEKQFAEKFPYLKPIRSFVSAPSFITEKLTVKPGKEKSEYIYVMPDGLYVQTPEHEAYDEDTIRCVTAFCAGTLEGGVCIPYDYPEAIDAAAEKYGFACRRITLEDKDRSLLCPIYDVYVRSSYLLSYMAKNGCTFADIVGKLPVFSSRRREVEVNADKASIMTTLSHGGGKELVEGVKIREKRGTVLIIPKKTKNAFSICAESADAETAAELCDYYVKKVKK